MEALIAFCCLTAIAFITISCIKQKDYLLTLAGLISFTACVIIFIDKL